MGFEHDNDQEALYEPFEGLRADTQKTSQPPPAKKTKKRSGWRIFWRIVLTLSIIANVFLLIGIVAMASLFAIGGGELFLDEHTFIEKTIVEGPVKNKIVVVQLKGIINNETSADVRQQIKAAKKDINVKALIIRTITPGGSVSASDRIHHEISKFRQETGKPVVAFMQTVAASGGYYTSVACDKIIAEPTVITGSIGVIMSHLMVKELLEEKLGISPVVVKSGRKKDWPTAFSETTDEQIQYLTDKLITPAYDRFVKLVTQGRKMLSEGDVRILADGSIYGAEEAQAKNLIDEIGYIEEAVVLARSLAGIEDGAVVEYTRPFSFSELLGAQGKTALHINTDTLKELAVPQLLYLWDAR